MFKVGYEIEAYFPYRMVKATPPSSGYSWSDSIDHHHEKIRVMLIEQFGDNSWAKKANVEYEGSLQNLLTVRGVSYFGGEIVTPPLPIDKARSVLKELFAWMEENKVATNINCGLHINISFTDKRKTNKINYTDLARLVPQKKILAQFKRSNNDACGDTDRVMRTSIEDLLGYRHRNSSVFLTRERSLSELVDLVENKSEVLLAEILNAVDEWVSSQIEYNNKELSIVEKYYNGERYFEFRMTGNKDYHKRYGEISRIITTYTRAMTKAIA